jgi:hypothetical protein
MMFSDFEWKVPFSSHERRLEGIFHKWLASGDLSASTILSPTSTSLAIPAHVDKIGERSQCKQSISALYLP